MLFNSIVFWVFFPLFFTAYFAVKGATRLWVCLMGSYLFYAWWDWRFLGLIVLLTGLNYWCGLRIESSKLGSSRRKYYVTFSVVCSLVILGFFKYFNFFIDSFASLTYCAGFAFSHGSMSIILPVGISFYTFQTMSYTIDLYRREVEVERSLLKFSVFVSFFPQLVAGPIVRAKDFLPQLQSDRGVSYRDLVSGLHLVLWGLFLKVVMADNLAVIVDPAFKDPSVMNGLNLAIAVTFYAFQIYGDFAGYSLIAIGLARMLGFHFHQNFNRPYYASSFSDFWKRWHISLSSWLRDYLYIPLGGNRKGSRRTQLNLMLTMLLGGLWHGAAWTFVVWGGLHGLYLVLQRQVPSVVSKAIPVFLSKLTAWFLVFAGVLIAWVFFRAQTFQDAFTVLEKIFTLDGFQPSSILRKFFFLKGMFIVAVVVLVEIISFRLSYDHLLHRWPFLGPVYAVACLLAIAFLGMFEGGSFIYFQF